MFLRDRWENSDPQGAMQVRVLPIHFRDIEMKLKIIEDYGLKHRMLSREIVRLLREKFDSSEYSVKTPVDTISGARMIWVYQVEKRAIFWKTETKLAAIDPVPISLGIPGEKGISIICYRMDVEEKLRVALESLTKFDIANLTIIRQGY